MTHIGESYDEMVETHSTRQFSELLLEHRLMVPEKRLWADSFRKTMLASLHDIPECSLEESRLALSRFLGMLIGIKIFNALDAEKDCTDFIEPLALMSRLAQLDVTSTIPDPFTVGHHVSLEGHAYLKRLEQQSSKLFDIFRRTYPGRKLFLLDTGESFGPWNRGSPAR